MRAAKEASQSSTAKYGSQYDGTSAGACDIIMPPTDCPATWNSVYSGASLRRQSKSAG